MALDPRDYIQKWGGKIGGHLYLRDIGGFEEFLPEADFLEPEQSFESVKSKRRYMESWMSDHKFADGLRMIVRGSHPNDHEGLVDVIQSRGDIRTRKDVEDAIKVIRWEANQPKVFSYNKFEGQPYDGRIRIQISDQLSDVYIAKEGVAIKGSVVEHPHKRETYIVEVAIPTVSKYRILERVVVEGENIVHCMTDGNVADLSQLDSMFDSGEYKKVIDLYTLVKFSEFVPEDTSFQMEFGHTRTPKKGKSNAQFFQARPFKKFEKPPYRLGNHDKSGYMCFGITPEEGIVLPLGVLGEYNDTEIMRITEPYALLILYNSRSMDLSFQPRHMHSYLAFGPRSASLEHNHFRWIRKAEVSVLDREQTRALDGKKIRIISNGINSIVEKIE